VTTNTQRRIQTPGAPTPAAAPTQAEQAAAAAAAAGDDLDQYDGDELPPATGAVETKAYADGTTATGTAPLPEQSPTADKPKTRSRAASAPAAQPVASAAEFTPEQQALIAQMIDSAVRASKASQNPRTAAMLAAGADRTKAVPLDVAVATAENSVAAGQRPRPILTPEGWYVHPDYARVANPDVARLGG
tara:strand:+ start:5873 stop:6442 length:570 start_codon:yes stop_codon:yes gene_type:complete